MGFYAESLRGSSLRRLQREGLCVTLILLNMADRVTIGKERVPKRPVLLLPNRLDLKALQALNEDLGGKGSVAWIVDRSLMPDREMLQYLTEVQATGYVGDLLREDAEDLRGRVRVYMELGLHVVLLLGHPPQAEGSLSDVPGALLHKMVSLGFPCLPLHVGMVKESAGGRVTVTSGDYDHLELRYGELLGSAHCGVSNVLASWMEAQADLYASQPLCSHTLGELLVRELRRHPETPLIDGVDDSRLEASQLLSLAILLAEKLRTQVMQGRVGIILPPGKLCTVTFVACVISGIIPVFINYEATAEEFVHAARRSELTRFITERRFQNKLSDFSWPPDRDLIYVENVLRGIPRARVTWMHWRLRFHSPEGIFRSLCAQPPGPESEAVVIFTGGTDQKPKGISLTHRMLLTGMAQLLARVELKRGDCILSVMPYGHPMSLVAGLLLPLLGGYGMVTYPSADAGGRLCTLVQRYGVTMTVSTPRSLPRLLSAAKPDTFSRVRYLFSVGEKLPENLADYARGKLGLRLLEAYSLSEIAPLVACEVPGPEATEGSLYVKPSCARGSVGEPLPGVAVRVADPDRVSHLMPCGELGMIWIKSATLVHHYIGHEADAERTNLHGGWLRTDDIGRMSEDGLLTICGRSSRFTKVDGILRAHEDLEQALLKVLGADPAKPGRQLAVVGVVDNEGCERLVLLSTLHSKVDASVHIAVQYGLKNAGYRHLAPPYRIVPVNYIPELPNGKLDYRRCIEGARKALGYDEADRNRARRRR